MFHENYDRGVKESVHRWITNITPPLLLVVSDHADSFVFICLILTDVCSFLMKLMALIPLLNPPGGWSGYGAGLGMEALRNVCAEAWDGLDEAEHWAHLWNDWAFSLKCLLKKNRTTLEYQSPKQRGCSCCDAFQRLGGQFVDYCLVVRCSASDPDSGVSCQILEGCSRPTLQDCRQSLAVQAGK